jgi:hypothetical protein
MSETEIKRLTGIWKLPTNYFEREQFDVNGVLVSNCDFCSPTKTSGARAMSIMSWLCVDHQREFGLRW